MWSSFFVSALNLQPQVSPMARRALGTVTSHPIVASNAYCEWFREGKANRAQARDLVQQFSVFSNLFLLAQLSRVINAPTLNDMRESKEILANEIGVIFKGPKRQDIFSPQGSVEGGTFSHKAAHFEWLVDVGESLGLGFEDLGKRRHGSTETLHFCDTLFDIYGSDDLSVSLGASFAIEHWANAGFWDDLLLGFKTLNTNGDTDVPLAFWRFHQALEAQHAQHTMDELEESIHNGLITDEAKFHQAANDMLDACGVFWQGLDDRRKALQ